MKTIKKTFSIHAPKEKVWEVLFADKYTKKWYAEFSEGSSALTDWKQGSKVIFKDHTGGGMVGRIVTNIPNELLSIKFDGVISKHKEDYDSDFAKQFKGAKETYSLKQKNGAIEVTVESDISEELYDTMSESWDRAIKKIGQLAAGN
jgi:uncharacterized protein YndB with AHSA1/START domain